MQKIKRVFTIKEDLVTIIIKRAKRMAKITE
jgi:hypothetical protein